MYDAAKEACVCSPEESGSYDAWKYGYICCFSRSIDDKAIGDHRCNDKESLNLGKTWDPNSHRKPERCQPCPPCATCHTDKDNLTLAGTFVVSAGFQLSKFAKGELETPKEQATSSTPLHMVGMFKCPHDNLQRSGCKGWTQSTDLGLFPRDKRMGKVRPFLTRLGWQAAGYNMPLLNLALACGAI